MMRSLKCPVPSNINPLQSNGFMFGIQKLPEISFFCQEANIPAISLPSPVIENPLVTTPIPGEKLMFDDLSITFLIDEDMRNYAAVYDWMIGLGFPKSHDQYKSFIQSRSNNLTSSELSAGYSDGTLQVLNNSNNVIRTIRFADLFPVAIQSLQLQSNTNDTFYLAGNATFKYTYYELI